MDRILYQIFKIILSIPLKNTEKILIILLERDNQENRREPFRSPMHWDLREIVYHRRKVLGGVTLFGERAGIRRFERMVG